MLVYYMRNFERVGLKEIKMREDKGKIGGDI